ncbi:MAG: preprotein translocase subunit SecY [Bacilli bacterium]|nr:preprotein translocase subunit SecY [Bacilli bacterium]
MFAKLKLLGNDRNKDLRNKLLFTFLCLFVFKLGTAIIVPGVDTSALGNGLGFLDLVNAMGGGAMEKFSILSLGVMPYITASIITQLLSQMELIPYLAELSKQGGVGRNKLNQITRVLGIVLAFIQGYILSFTLLPNGSAMDYMMFSTVLTAGTAFLLWIGDQITSKGIGNGISLIIMAGIIATLPNMFKDAFAALVVNGDLQVLLLGITKFVLFVIIYLAIILAVVYEETSERRIPVQYANKSNSVYGANKNYMPFKLNSSGVMPVIFASAIISIPGLLAGVIKNEGFSLFVSKWMTLNTIPGFILYLILIILFTLLYTFMQIKPKELSENLNKQGGFIPGVRPGDETVKYINKILKRISTVGALFLAFIAALPIVFGMISNLPSSVRIGGTGLLIVVGVALETYKQIESKLVTGEYVRGRRRR